MNNFSYSVIIVTFNNQTTIRSLLNSLIKKASAKEIIVVDNHSSDQTSEIVKKFKVNLIRLDKNIGFSRANNLAAKMAQSEYLIFLNPDSELLHKGSLESLIRNLSVHPEYGLVGPKFIMSDGTTQLTVRHQPTLLRAFKEYILAEKGSYDFYNPECTRLCSVESIVGAGMVIKKYLFDKFGGFNEKYFLFYEDLDLCQKVLKLGLKVGYLPTVRLKHIVGVSTKGPPKMPIGIRTLSWFIPIRSSGSRYYMVKSSIIYHGFIVATLIRIIIYLGVKIERLLGS